MSSSQWRAYSTFLLVGLVPLFGLRAPARAHGPVGPVKPPIQVPDLSVTASDGQRVSIHKLLSGKVTVIQLMFTKCSTLCPIEAGTLAHVEEALADSPGNDIQILSVTTEPATDTPKILNSWLRRFGAREHWHAVSPVPADLLRAKAFFNGPVKVDDNHSTALYIVDRNGFLVWRTPDLPDAKYVAKLAKAFARDRRIRMGR